MTRHQTIETWNRKKVQHYIIYKYFLGKDMITISMTLETHTMLTKNIHTPPHGKGFEFSGGWEILADQKI